MAHDSPFAHYPQLQHWLISESKSPHGGTCCIRIGGSRDVQSTNGRSAPAILIYVVYQSLLAMINELISNWPQVSVPNLITRQAKHHVPSVKVDCHCKCPSDSHNQHYLQTVMHTYITFHAKCQKQQLCGPQSKRLDIIQATMSWKRWHWLKFMGGNK